LPVLSDDDFESLPEDPKLAFVEYARRLRIVVSREAQQREDSSVERSFAYHMKAFTDTVDVGINFNAPPADENNFWVWYRDFSNRIDYHSAKIKLERRFFSFQSHRYIEFDEDYRIKIHQHLNKVRKIVNAAQIEERLRENIYTRLNALAAEVDKGRSGLVRFADAFVEISAAIGDGAEKLEPAVKIMERIGALFGKARKENDVKSISGGEEQKLISGPVVEIPNETNLEATDGGEEIPF